MTAISRYAVAFSGALPGTFITTGTPKASSHSVYTSPSSTSRPSWGTRSSTPASHSGVLAFVNSLLIVFHSFRGRNSMLRARRNSGLPAALANAAFADAAALDGAAFAGPGGLAPGGLGGGVGGRGGGRGGWRGGVVTRPKYINRYKMP